MKEHHYHPVVTWTGNRGEGTKDYKAYERDHTIEVPGKPVIPGTSEVSYFGNQSRYNPEEMLTASVSACHMLWYLYLCAVNKIIITAYTDKPVSTMQNTADGGGHFTDIILKPEITVAGKADEELLGRLHQQANQLCFIANSLNFPVRHEPMYLFV